MKTNVRSTATTAIAGPLIRELTTTKLIQRNGATWLMWNWKAEPKEGGEPDCGYAGLREDDESFPEMKTRFGL